MGVVGFRRAPTRWPIASSAPGRRGDDVVDVVLCEEPTGDRLVPVFPSAMLARGTSHVASRSMRWPRPAEGAYARAVPDLQRLRADHAPAILDFERANRAYFAARVGDRGDEFFARFAELHATRLAEQESGDGAYYVLVDEDGAVLG